MKKLLILVLVLGMTSMANAGLIFTVNGEEQGPEITIGPSDIIELDLELSAGSNIMGYAISYSIEGYADLAELITDGATGSYPGITEPMTDIEFPWGSDLDGKVNNDPPPSDYVEITAGNFFNPSDGPLTLMEELYLHCLDCGDVVLTIAAYGNSVIDGQTIPGGTTLHTLTIHQVPEPATMLLLGLGGLFLRRRK